MRYKPKMFYDSMGPEKRKSDSLLVKLVIRPTSYLVASILASLGASANGVSFFSILLGIGINVLLFLDNQICRIVGASLIFVWLVLDGVDGNIARTVRKQSYGEFMDGAGGYFLISFLLFSVGKICFDTGGLWFQKGDFWSLVLGGLFAICMTLSRLLYQKFKTDPSAEPSSNDSNKKASGLFQKLKKAEDRVSKEFGLAGLMPIALLVTVIFSWTDVFLLVYGCFFSLLFLASSLYFFLMVLKKNHQEK